ncbi:MIP family Ig-specific serine endopeptidase [Mycoplasmopsis synoviae]|uniref:DUF31 family protein n=3 Tax=Mycoplasmopsis synoviae TaxID=2109 RepID=A0AAQ2TC87_MYCSY|nr:DUF31 family protein [Mycoplasmopsis synoviae]AKJ20890.1 hypothetical protein MSHv_04180 [Mycoplasmopsis synoviae]AQU48215.1 hypothetical protein ADF19_04180 [Mycoplasmopsis synoviae]AWL84427.1 hypothetical protein MSH_03445 [Mycoplasmopsis synoviae]QLE14144.1 hypothetical protein DEH79_03440 [Mycoplasmopsis synoviae]UZF64292.1 DUF31 family protein [Mycoplasmopsis synoviae]
MKLKWLKKLIVPTSLVTLTTAIAISCGAPVADDKKDEEKKQGEQDNPKAPTNPSSSLVDQKAFDAYVKEHNSLIYNPAEKGSDKDNYPTNFDALKAIADRSFSLYVGMPNPQASYVGTMWLLDYQKVSDTQYKMFFGTNFHVAAGIVTAQNVNENVAQNDVAAENRPIGFTIRAAVGTNPNDRNATTGRNYYETSVLSETNKFKVFWHARNFVKRSEELNQVIAPDKDLYTDFSVLEWDVDFNDIQNNPNFFFNPNLRAETSTSTDGSNTVVQTVSDEVAAKRKANNDRFIEKLKNAVAAVDNQIALGKKTTLYNHLAGTPFNFDFSTSLNVKDKYEATNLIYKRPTTPEQLQSFASSLTQQEKDFLETKYVDTPRWVNLYGFPLIQQNEGFGIYASIWQEAGEPNRLQEKGWDVYPKFQSLFRFDRTQLGKESAITLQDGRKIIQASFNNKTLYFYGYQYKVTTPVDVSGGVSGALVTDTQGLSLGIFNSKDNSFVTASDSERPELGEWRIFNIFVIPFTQMEKIGRVEAYNLIDGTDKTKFPNQTSSYRDQLRLVYNSGSTKFKTALFPEGA